MSIVHLMNRGFKYLTNSDYRFCIQAGKGKYNNMPDEEYLKRMFRARLGYTLDLDNPQTFNEKLQWLKLHDRKPIYSTMVDKYEAKGYVANIIGEQYIIPTLGVWNHFDEIDFDKLPTQFVLKTTHDSGGVIIVTDKNKLDKKAAKEKIEKSLKNNFYWWSREWPYKNVRPRIIAEKFIAENINDYKFFCFGGQAKCLKADYDRFVQHHANYYDTEGNILDFGEAAYPPDPKKKLEINIDTLKLMETLANELSKGHSFLRTDFYSIDDKIYFGELTFYPASGFGKFTNKIGDQLLGKWINIPNSCVGGYMICFKGIIAVLKNTCRKFPQLKDYKIQCFHGNADNIMVCTDRRNGGPFYYYFDKEWNYLPYSTRADSKFHELNKLKPNHLEEMITISEKLSRNIPELRVDLYEVNKKIYFGELTFFTGSGFDSTITNNADYILGKKLNLCNMRT